MREKNVTKIVQLKIMYYLCTAIEQRGVAQPG